MDELVTSAIDRVRTTRDSLYSVVDAKDTPSPAEPIVRPCLTLTPTQTHQYGGAVLCGLRPARFSWDFQSFLKDQPTESRLMTKALQMLANEYDMDNGVNEKFRCMIQTPRCVLGCASKSTQRQYRSLALGNIPLGATVGSIDCHVGGVQGSCSEAAASISYIPNEEGSFQFACESSDDVVTLNGQRLTMEMGPHPVHHEDVCSIGARVFVFLLPGT
jgi:hypothetical protein